jgi:hypothetical protein
MKKLAWLCTSAFSVALVSACGGGGGGSSVIPATPTATAASTPTNAPLATVDFVVTVQPSTAPVARVRPKFAAPSGTASLTITLVSNNGTAATGASQSFNLSGSDCTPAQNPTSCTFPVQAVAGTDIFHVTTYGAANEQGPATGAGTVSVNAVSGQTTTAPSVLSGTVASISLQLETLVVPEGAATTIPLALVAKDANGNTIIGSYTNAIAVSDTDASGQTNISASSIPDSTTAASLSLSYAGGAMTNAATISASASGVAQANITSATFAPNTTYPTVSGASLTYGTWEDGMTGSYGPTPPPQLQPGSLLFEPATTGTQTVTISTVNFNGVGNAIDVETQVSASPTPLRSDLYYTWSTSATSATLQFLGSSTNAGNNGIPMINASDGFFFYYPGTLTCASPYQTAWVVPLPASWDARSGSGACTFAGTYGTSGLNGTLNANGSYTLDETSSSGVAQMSIAANADGTASGWFTYSSGSDPQAQTDYAVYVAMPTPAPGASTIPYQITSVVGTIPSPNSTQTPAPTTTNAPNWYLAAGLTNGTIPQPLASTVYTNKGAVTSLPSQCAVSSTLVGSNPSYTEVDESSIEADPLGSYVSNQYRYFLIDGLGVACVYMTSQVNNVIYLWDPPVVSGGDYNIFAAYLTSSTLQAAQSHTRDVKHAVLLAQPGLFAIVRAHEAALRRSTAQVHL